MAVVAFVLAVLFVPWRYPNGTYYKYDMLWNEPHFSSDLINPSEALRRSNSWSDFWSDYWSDFCSAFHFPLFTLELCGIAIAAVLGLWITGGIMPRRDAN